MMTPAELLLKMTASKDPSEIFGADLENGYHHMRILYHPDKFATAADEVVEAAAAAFKKLEELYTRAKAPPTTITSKLHTYRMRAPIAAGDYTDVYRAEDPLTVGASCPVIKISRLPADNKVIENEFALITKIKEAAGDKIYGRLFPTPVETFMIHRSSVGQRVAVYECKPQIYSLEQVRERYPDGIDFRDAVWMYKRLLMALGFIHDLGICHGAVTPSHVLVDIADHGIVLGGFTHSVEIGKPLKTITAKYEDMYSPEVFKKGPSAAFYDSAMAAKCLEYVVGGNQLPGTVRGFLLAAKAKTALHAWEQHDAFDDIVKREVGKPKFRHFSMS